MVQHCIFRFLTSHACSLPVIWISAYSHHYPKFATQELHKIWIIAVTFNSFYAFMWDVIMDWGLCQADAHQFLLREKLIYTIDGESKYFYV